MAEQGNGFRKLEMQRPPRAPESSTPEQRHWRRYKTSLVTKAYAAVHCVAFSPAAPYDFAVTNSTRVQIYGSRGKAVKKTISRFKDIVYTTSFRDDGKLLVAAGEERIVKVFDVESGGMLRMLKGHSKPVHACGFSRDRLHCISGGDDAVVKYWDVATGEDVINLEGHRDHVRCVTTSPTSQDVLVSGSYDHTVKLWDCRKGSDVLTVDHGQPVQAVLMLPGGGVMVTAGGNVMKIWDVLAGGRILQAMANHSKPITCLAYDENGGRILSGSLDHHLKVYDVQEYRVRYSLDYQQPILSLGFSQNQSTIAVGMANGLLNVRSRPTEDEKISKVKAKKNPRGGTFQYFIRGQYDKANDDDDFRVERIRKQKLAAYDKMIIASLLHELYIRDCARIALSGRDETTLIPILKFICKYISVQAYTSLLTDVSNTILELYTVIIGRSEAVDELFWKIRMRVHEQLMMDANLVALQGSLELILASTLH